MLPASARQALAGMMQASFSRNAKSWDIELSEDCDPRKRNPFGDSRGAVTVRRSSSFSSDASTTEPQQRSGTFSSRMLSSSEDADPVTPLAEGAGLVVDRSNEDEYNDEERRLVGSDDDTSCVADDFEPSSSQAPAIDKKLIDSMREVFPELWKAASRTSRKDFEALSRAGLQIKIAHGEHGLLDVIDADVRRSAEWFKSPMSEQTSTWPFPRLDAYQLSLLRKVLLAFAARADECLKAGSLKIHAPYVQGWNYLARMLLFASDFDEWATFRVFEGLMLDHGMARFADTEENDQLWTRVFARYDDWYGKQLGPFGNCNDAQLFFMGMAGTSIQMSGFTVGLPPLTALKTLAAAVNVGRVAAPAKLEEMLAGAIARTVRLAGVRPRDLDMVNPPAAFNAMTIARAGLAEASVARGITITAQLRIALRFQQRVWCQKMRDAFILRLTLKRARHLWNY